MSMTVQNVRDYVRSFLDTDTEELPDALLDPWITEGAERIQRQPWMLSWFAKQWTLATVASTGEYLFSTIGDDVDSISGVEGERWSLHQLPHRNAVRKYAWTNLTSEPIEYSVRGTSLFLWNVPNDTYTLIVHGYRSAVPASAASAVIDLPSEFHMQVAEWALSRAYEQQDDPEAASSKQQNVINAVDQMSRRYRRDGTSGDFVIGEFNVRDQFTRGRLAYEWE